MAVGRQLFSSRCQVWGTPRPLFEGLDQIFAFRLDPCCERRTAKCKRFFTKREDGLRQDWACVGNAFVNPPYMRELPFWVKKCQEEGAKGITVVMLIPARTDTSYWHDMIFRFATLVCFVRGRIKFVDGRDGRQIAVAGAPFPSAFVIFGNCEPAQAERLTQFGAVFDLRKNQVVSRLQDRRLVA